MNDIPGRWGRVREQTPANGKEGLLGIEQLSALRFNIGRRSLPVAIHQLKKWGR